MMPAMSDADARPGRQAADEGTPEPHYRPPALVAGRWPTVVLDDWPCGQCGYNLRTLSMKAVCPECACPVAASVRSSLLRHADRQWLGEVRIGLRCLSLGVAAVPLATALVAILSVAFAFLPAIALVWILVISDIGLLVAGVVLMTQPEPNPVHRESHWSCRTMLRVLLGVLFLVVPVALGVEPGLATLIGLLLVVSLVVLSVRHLARLMARTGKSALGSPYRRAMDALLLVPAGLAISMVFLPHASEFLCPLFGVLTVLLLTWLALARAEQACKVELQLAERYRQVVARVAARRRAVEAADSVPGEGAEAAPKEESA